MGKGDSAETHTEPIAVFTALAWESAAVRSILRQVKQVETRIWRGSTGEHDVLVITGGIGPRRTRETVSRFVSTPLSAVISVGCAGALIPGLETGQLVLASDVRMQPAKDDDRIERYPVDLQLLAHARAVAAHVGVPAVDGSLFTSSKVLFTPEEKARQREQTGAIAVEMESGVHAAFAEKRGLPFLVLRVILDGVDMTIPAVAGLTTPDGEVRYVRAATYVATHPHHLPALLAIKRARETAARSITQLCRALFARLSA